MLVSTPSNLTPVNTRGHSSQNIQEVSGSIYINPKIHINRTTTASRTLEILMTNIGGANTSGQSIESIVDSIQGSMANLSQKELSIIAGTTIPEGKYSQVLYDVRLYAKMLLQSL